MNQKYFEGNTHANYIFSKEERIKALKLRFKYFLGLSRNLMNVAVELASIKKQLEKEGVTV